jgi:hypothetical protein
MCDESEGSGLSLKEAFLIYHIGQFCGASEKTIAAAYSVLECEVKGILARVQPAPVKLTAVEVKEGYNQRRDPQGRRVTFRFDNGQSHQVAMTAAQADALSEVFGKK